ncbi:hypothetical protein [Haladaptatus cibarius]|uniref:hypothetical protein n=1 Tax=Haladaptatus cibarius TaxID=453847 RepID=UPI000678CAB1|nr:hypothetical protein [Haladaptatus cibarius]
MVIAGTMGVFYLPYFTSLNVTATRRSESSGELTRVWPLLVGVTGGLGVGYYLYKRLQKA